MRQVEDRVTHQDFIVEVHEVKADHQVGAQQLLDQIVDAVLRKDLVLIQVGAESDSERHSHVPLPVPSPDVISSALSFEIKVNNVHPERVSCPRNRGYSGDRTLVKRARVKSKEIFKAGEMVFLNTRSVGGIASQAVCAVGNAPRLLDVLSFANLEQ